jgi:nucleotide-binding universal stress UspA family protein
MVMYKRILCPTDFSGPANKALQYACDLAAQYDAELHLLHVLPDPVAALTAYGPVVSAIPPDWEENMRAQVNQQLADALDKNWEKGKTVRRSISEGVAFAEIIRYARDNAIDLIVMGTHGRTGFNHFIMGSEAEKVVRNAPCPVLTIPPEERD